MFIKRIKAKMGFIKAYSRVTMCERSNKNPLYKSLMQCKRGFEIKDVFMNYAHIYEDIVYLYNKEGHILFPFNQYFFSSPPQRCKILKVKANPLIGVKFSKATQNSQADNLLRLLFPNKVSQTIQSTKLSDSQKIALEILKGHYTHSLERKNPTVEIPSIERIESLRDEILSKVPNAKVYLTGSIALNLLGWIERTPKDVDFSLVFNTSKELKKAQKLYPRKVDNKGYQSTMVQFKSGETKVDCFLHTKEEFTPSGVKYGSVEIQSPLEIMTHKSVVTSYEHRNKFLGDVKSLKRILKTLGGGELI